MKVEFLGNPVTLTGTRLKVDDDFPDFRLIDSNFNKVTLNKTHGKRIFLTIPSLVTDTCSTEISKFKNYLKDKGITCYIISLDLPFVFTKLYTNINENIHFLSDVKYKNYGKATGTYIKELGILTRSVTIVDENNKVIYTEYLHEVSDEPDYENALKFI